MVLSTGAYGMRASPLSELPLQSERYQAGNDSWKHFYFGNTSDWSTNESNGPKIKCKIVEVIFKIVEMIFEIKHAFTVPLQFWEIGTTGSCLRCLYHCGPSERLHE